MTRRSVFWHRHGIGKYQIWGYKFTVGIDTFVCGRTGCLQLGRKPAEPFAQMQRSSMLYRKYGLIMLS